MEIKSGDMLWNEIKKPTDVPEGRWQALLLSLIALLTL